MYWKYDERDLMSALRTFDEMFDGLERASRKSTNKCDCDCCKELPDGTWEVETETEEPGIEFGDILDDVRQVIYNDPATIVTFKDGTKVCVKACKNDKFCKETGLVYAIIKRLYANDIDEKTGYLRSKGLGEKISNLVKQAIDQNKLEAERKAKREAKRNKKESAGNSDSDSND